MSIKSDKWIRRQCQPPTHVIIGVQDEIIQFFTPKNKDELELVQFRCDKQWSGMRLREARPYDLASWKPMIDNFVERQMRGPEEERQISYGVSSYGYDVRCTNKFKVFTNINSAVVDPKNFDHNAFVDVEADVCIIPPNSFALATTVEYFRIPRNILTICLGKSTYARCGIIVNVTPLEPEWEGQVTLEFSNTTTLPAKIYANEGVAQMLFLESDEDCEVSYKDRGGKYQGQEGVTLPRS